MDGGAGRGARHGQHAAGQRKLRRGGRNIVHLRRHGIGADAVPRNDAYGLHRRGLVQDERPGILRAVGGGRCLAVGGVIHHAAAVARNGDALPGGRVFAPDHRLRDPVIRTVAGGIGVKIDLPRRKGNAPAVKQLAECDEFIALRLQRINGAQRSRDRGGIHVVHQHDRTVLRGFQKLLIRRIRVAALPVAGVHRPVEARHARRVEHGLVIRAVRRTEHVGRIKAQRAVENAVHLRQLLPHARRAQLGELRVAVGMAANLVPLQPCASHGGRVAAAVDALHEEAHMRTARGQTVQQRRGIL